MWNTNENRPSPEVDRIIKPIIMDMTKIDLIQQNNPQINSNNEDKNIKRMKRRCVHITWDGVSNFTIRARMQDDGRFVCAVCGQEIGTEFDDDAIDDYFRCLKRVNQACLFGLLNGMSAGPLQGFIALKEMLPDAAKVHRELNIIASKENKDNNAIANIGSEYATGNVFGNITGYYGGR
jgi:hypothetical protein